MAAPARALPTEVFGLPLNPGRLAGPVRDQLERRRRDRLCPFLMVECPRPYPICSVAEAGQAIPICPHRLLEGQAIFRSLAPYLPGSRPTLLRHVHPLDGPGFLGWLLFDAHHPDEWIGVNTMTPLPAEETALAEALHDLFLHGELRTEGYALSFDWPACTADGSRWVAHLGEWARTWHRPVYSFLPAPLFEHLRAAIEVQGTSPGPLRLVPMNLERGGSGWRVRVSTPTVAPVAAPERGGMWRAILRHWPEWISLDIVGEIRAVAAQDRAGL